MTFEFKSNTEWIEGVIGNITIRDVAKLKFALPKEFGGEEAYVNPEEIFLSSLAACFSAMLWRMLRAQRVQLRSYKADVVGRMDKDEEGYIRFKEATLSVRIQLVDESDVEKVKKAVDLSERYCPVGRVVKGNIELKFDVSITV